MDGIVVEYKIETTSFAEAEAIEAGVLGADDVACLDDASTTGLYDFGCSQISTPAWCSMLDDADFTASEQCCACGGGNAPKALMAQGLADAAAGTSSEDLFFGVAVEAMGVEIVSTFAPTASPTTFWDNKQSSSNEKFEAILQGERGMGLQLVVLMALVVAALVGGCCCYFSAKALSGAAPSDQRRAEEEEGDAPGAPAAEGPGLRAHGLARAGPGRPQAHLLRAAAGGRASTRRSSARRRRARPWSSGPPPVRVRARRSTCRGTRPASDGEIGRGAGGTARRSRRRRRRRRPRVPESAPPAALGCGLMDLDCGLDTTDDAPADLEDGPIPYNASAARPPPAPRPRTSQTSMRHRVLYP